MLLWTALRYNVDSARFSGYGFNMQPSENQMPQVTPEVIPSQSPSNKKSVGQKILLIIITLFLIGVAGYAGYYFGTKKADEHHHDETPMSQALTVPKDATVTAECVENRGKQYIVPKDIPDGPIYDVNNGKVVAVEYLVDTNEIAKSPDKFKNLVAQATFDHLAIIPMDAHAGVSEKHVHVVAYTISTDEASKITCVNSTPSAHTH